MILADTTWPDVALALIPTLASLGAAYIAYLVKRDVRTPSGDPLGHVVERAHEAGIANNLLLRSLTDETKPANGTELRAAEPEGLHVPAPEPEPPATG